MDLKDFLQLAGKQGKVLVIGDDGNAKGIFLPFDEYQKLSGGKPQQQAKPQEDIVEKVNREILQAQLEDVISSNDGGNSASQLLSDPVAVAEEPIDLNPPERIDSLINKRAQDLFKTIPNYNYIPPEVATSVDEEIKPNFDDI
jgi:hypothetical protein